MPPGARGELGPSELNTLYDRREPRVCHCSPINCYLFPLVAQPANHVSQLRRLLLELSLLLLRVPSCAPH